MSGTTLCAGGKSKLVEDQQVTKGTLLAPGSFYNKRINPTARKQVPGGCLRVVFVACAGFLVPQSQALRYPVGQAAPRWSPPIKGCLQDGALPKALDCGLEEHPLPGCGMCCVLLHAAAAAVTQLLAVLCLSPA